MRELSTGTTVVRSTSGKCEDAGGKGRKTNALAMGPLMMRGERDEEE